MTEYSHDCMKIEVDGLLIMKDQKEDFTCDYYANPKNQISGQELKSLLHDNGGIFIFAKHSLNNR